MTTKVKFAISGMHCTSCSMHIDGELEDTEGVKKASTNYAKALTEVTFDTDKLTEKAIVSIIKQVGYTAQVVKK